MLDQHLEIHRVLEQQDQMLNGNPYPAHILAAHGQHALPAPPPMYPPNFPGFLGPYPVNHGYYAPVPFQPPAAAQRPYYCDRVDNPPAPPAPVAAPRARDRC